MTATAFDQFRRFSTDAYGLERLIRFLQASVQIFLCMIASPPTVYRAIFDIFSNSQLHRPLAELADRLGQARRFIRFFRFLDAFSDSYRVLTSLTELSDDKKTNGQSSTVFLTKTLDGLAGAFNGLYLLLEAVTLVDGLNISGLAICGPELEVVLKIESQRCWLISLVAGALGCALRLSKLRNSRVIKSVEGKATEKDAKTAVEERRKIDDEMCSMVALKRRLTRKMVACLLDIVLPGSILGWIPASKSSVAVVTIVTSILTGVDVWERCGKEIGRT